MISIVDSTQDFIYFTSSTRLGTAIGATWTVGRKAWRLPINKHSVESLLQYVQGKDISFIKSLLFTLDNYYEKVYNIKSKVDAEGDTRLRPYQKVDVEFIALRESAGIFNEQRTGKTPTTLVALKPRMKRNIIITPSGLKLNWAKEFVTWTGMGESYVITGTPKKRYEMYGNFAMTKHATLIIGYETLRNDVDIILKVIKKFDVLIADEAHRLRNFKTKQSKAVYKIGKVSQNCFPLTGTPAVNHPSDVFGILKLIRPSKFTSFWNFVERYFGYSESYFGREISTLRKDRQEEFQGMLNVMSVQRKRKDVMKWLPKIIKRDIELEMTPRQAKFYDEITRGLLNGEVIPNTIAQLIRLRQASLDPNLIAESKTPYKSPKMEFIKEYLKDNPNETVMVFSMFTSFLKVLKKNIPQAVMLTGDENQLRKQASVDAIQNGKAKVIFANIIAGSVGWTLDNVDTIIFTDWSYSPVDMQQASDRIVPTQKDVVYGGKQIINLDMKGSVDYGIRQAVSTKEGLIAYVNNYGINGLVKLNENKYNKKAGDEK